MRSVPSAVSRGLGVLLFFATNVILATESLYADKQTSSTELVKLEFYILLPTDINTRFLFVCFFFVINPTLIPFITPTGNFYFLTYAVSQLPCKQTSLYYILKSVVVWLCLYILGVYPLPAPVQPTRPIRPRPTSTSKPGTYLIIIRRRNNLMQC